MTLQVLRDPRPYLLAVMAAALIVLVPLMFALVTLMDRPFGAESGTASIALWVLLALAVVGLLAGVMVMLARATRLSEAEHRPPDGGRAS
jgi:hypothetical protein